MMDAIEFGKICGMVAILIACIVWLSIATERQDQQDKDNEAYEKFQKDLADSIMLGHMKRRRAWLDKMAERTPPAQEGMFSATDADKDSGSAVDRACADAAIHGIGMVQIRDGVPTWVPHADIFAQPADSGAIADKLIDESIASEKLRYAPDGRLIAYGMTPELIESLKKISARNATEAAGPAPQENE